MILIRDKHFPFIFMLLLSLTPILSIETPRILCFWPVLTGALMSLWWVTIKKEKLLFSKTYAISVIAMSALCLVSSFWSINPAGTFEEAAKASLILIASIPLIGLMRAVPVSLIRPYFWIFPVCVGLAAALSAFELAYTMPVYNFLRAEKLDDLWDNTAVMNRGVVCVAFAYFIGLLFIIKMTAARYIRIILLCVMTVPTLSMLYLTQSQSGQVAFAVAALGAVICPCRYKLSYKTLWLLIGTCMLITPTIVYGAYALLISDGQDIAWLKDAYAGNRVEVWQFVMAYALDNPLYGFGMEATRFVEYFDHAKIYHEDTSVLHPHNFSIQTWMEFGIIGVFLACALFAFIVKGLHQTPSLPDRQIATGLFLSVMTVAAVGYGILQSWWLGEVIFLIALYQFITKSETTETPEEKNTDT